MDVDKTYFSNITKRERAIFEGAISMGALFHQFVGTPVNKNSKRSLEISMEESLKLQPAIENVQVEIRFDKLEESMTEFDYTSLTGDMLDVRIFTKVDDVKAIIRIEFVEELNYPLMYVEKIEDYQVSRFPLNLLTILLNDFFWYDSSTPHELQQ